MLCDTSYKMQASPFVIPSRSVTLAVVLLHCHYIRAYSVSLLLDFPRNQNFFRSDDLTSASPPEEGEIVESSDDADTGESCIIDLTCEGGPENFRYCQYFFVLRNALRILIFPIAQLFSILFVAQLVLS